MASDLQKWFELEVSLVKRNKKVQAGIATTKSGQSIFVKRYLFPWFWDRWSLFLYNDKAKRQFKFSELLNNAGVPAPAPLAVFRDLSSSLPSVFYVSEALCGYNSLKSTLLQLYEYNSREANELIAHVADTIARIHTAGIVHGDLKWSNILLNPSQRFETWVIDLDNAQHNKFPAKKRYALDLARVTVDMAFHLPDPKFFATFIKRYSDRTEISLSELIQSIIPYFKRRCRKNLERNKSEVTNLSSLAMLVSEISSKEAAKIK